MAEKQLLPTPNEVRITKGKLDYVTSVVIPAYPVGKTTTSELFTRRDFEDALDKVSRPQRKPERAS